MSLADYYRQQYRFRPWSRIHGLLGNLTGQRVLDLGAGIGDQAADLARLGAEVVGVEANEELVREARARGIPRAQFICGDLASLDFADAPADGIWLSFTVAYFPRIGEALDRWSSWLKPGGFLAVTELDDLFGHEPLAPRYRAWVEQYYDRSFQEGLHCFRSRERLCQALAARGFRLEIREELPDLEFAFDGPAEDAVLASWRTRLDWMTPRFVERFGAEAAALKDAFLDCLASPAHRSHAKLWFVLARSPDLVRA